MRSLVVAALLALVAPATAVAGPQAQPEPIPRPGEIVSSSNMTQLANLPKQAPFDGVNSFGTDIAFQRNLAYVGNYDGFVVYDVRTPGGRPS
jgi:hypothetical protein